MLKGSTQQVDLSLKKSQRPEIAENAENLETF